VEPGGWILLGVSWAAISGLAAFCLYRVLSERDGS
jgi:hypothetical protein